VSSPIKVCRCCSRTFDAEAWGRLEVPGGGRYMTDGETVLELRNCPCGTTLALPAPEIDPREVDTSPRPS